MDTLDVINALLFLTIMIVWNECYERQVTSAVLISLMSLNIIGFAVRCFFIIRTGMLRQNKVDFIIEMGTLIYLIYLICTGIFA